MILNGGWFTLWPSEFGHLFPCSWTESSEVLIKYQIWSIDWSIVSTFCSRETFLHAETDKSKQKGHRWTEKEPKMWWRRFCAAAEGLPWKPLSHGVPPRHGDQPLPLRSQEWSQKRLFKENVSCCCCPTWCVHWALQSVGVFRLHLLSLFNKPDESESAAVSQSWPQQPITPLI